MEDCERIPFAVLLRPPLERVHPPRARDPGWSGWLPSASCGAFVGCHPGRLCSLLAVGHKAWRCVRSITRAGPRGGMGWRLAVGLRGLPGPSPVGLAVPALAFNYGLLPLDMGRAAVGNRLGLQIRWPPGVWGVIT